MKTMLLESHSKFQRDHKLDPLRNTRGLMADVGKFKEYVKTLAEGLDAAGKQSFYTVCGNIRTLITEQSSYGVNPYESLLLPVFRVMWPRTIARDLVTTIAMSKPDMFKPFIRARFAKANQNTWNTAPVMSDVSSGPRFAIPVDRLTIDVPSDAANLITMAGLSKGNTHVEHNMSIVGVGDGDDTTGVVAFNVVPDINGKFAVSVTLPNGDTDRVNGIVDFETGDITVSSATGQAKKIYVSGTLSLEENTMNPKVELYLENLRLVATDRQVSGSWTIQMEQDIKALYDLDAQAEMAATIGKQITQDLDIETVANLIAAAEMQVGHTDSFDVTPPAGFINGPKQWHENILPKLNRLSATIANDTNIQSANVIAANPLDAAILESLQGFSYKGDAYDGGDLGVSVATMNANKWKVLVSGIVPKGKMLMTFKPAEEANAVYLFAVYQPLVLTPYPMGRTPSMTFISRNANTLVRGAGTAVLNILHN